MKQNKGFGVLVIVVVIAIILATVVGLVMVKAKKNINKMDGVTSQEEVVDSSSMIPEKEMDSNKMELDTKMENGNNLDDIESDLENTAILEEDFSDL